MYDTPVRREGQQKGRESGAHMLEKNYFFSYNKAGTRSFIQMNTCHIFMQKGRGSH